MCNLAPADFAMQDWRSHVARYFFVKEAGKWKFYVKNFFLNTGNKFDILENTVQVKQNMCAGWI